MSTPPSRRLWHPRRPTRPRHPQGPAPGRDAPSFDLWVRVGESLSTAGLDVEVHGQYPLGDSWRLLVCFYFFFNASAPKKNHHSHRPGASAMPSSAAPIEAKSTPKSIPAAIAKPQSRKNMAPTTKRTAECPVFGVWRDAPPRDWMRPDEGAGGGDGGGEGVRLMQVCG